jgi:transcriptional regulator with XRE-family HTH domain
VRGVPRGPPNNGANGLPSGHVNAANDIAEFLATRRARITPEQAGLPSYGMRRVPGLRREEVASLAGVSADYYRRLERGQVSGVSELVLEALARALQLDEAERAHLFDLARAASPVAPKRSRPAKKRVRPVVQRLLDQIEAPAIVSTVHGDYLAANALGRALYAPVFESPEQQPVNSARFTFLDPAAVDFYPDWERLASELVANLRSQAGRNPYDRSLQDLIGELSTRSEEFRVRWAAHNVRSHRTGTKRLRHPIVGELELSYETLTLDADDGLRLALYTAEAGSASQQALDLLASWTATPDPTESRLHGETRGTPRHER